MAFCLTHAMLLFCVLQTVAVTSQGLYFCGGSSHPGDGVPLVILSGAMASGLIAEDALSA